MTYAIGAAARLTTTIRDSAGTLINPSSVQVTIQLPDGTSVGPFNGVNDSVGLYHYDYTTVMAGRHIARWVTASPVGVDEEPFEVAAQWAEAGIVGLAEAKLQLNIPASNTTHDEEIAGHVRSATLVCERHVGSVVRRTVVEKHDGGRLIVLNEPPVISVTAITAIRPWVIAPAVADVDVDGPTGAVERLDGGWLRGPLRVTYLAGRVSVPDNVSQAAKIIIQHLWDTQRGISGSVRVGGQDEVYQPQFGFAIPRRALELLGDQPPAGA